MLRYALPLFMASPLSAQAVPDDFDLSLLPATRTTQSGSGAAATCKSRLEDGTIVVCANPEPVRSKYRLPDREGVFDPRGPLDSVSRERLGHMQTGREGIGIGSCDGVGAGADIGCNAAKHRRMEAQNPGGVLSF